MSTTIPDLWSDDIQVDVLTPLVILRAQESRLGRKTQGILEARVTTVATEAWIQHQLDLIAPALSTTRDASTWNTFPPLSASTPTALPSLIRIFLAYIPPRTVRFR